MKKIVVDGNEACANAAYLFTEVSAIYPITPSSPMAELIDKWSNEGRKNLFGDSVKVVEMQSEAGAAGMLHGALEAGTLATTFTASQGLLLMIPNMYKMSYEMLPCVMHVAARSLSTHALSIMGDHQDIYLTRPTGFALLASTNPSDAYYLALVAHLSSIKSSIPFLHFFDGFRTSHEINKIDIIEEEDIKNLIDKRSLENFRNKALNPMNPTTRGTNQNDDIYFQIMETRNEDYDKLPDIVNEYMQKINILAGKNYKPFNYYGSKTAKKVIVAMGSINDTIKEVIDTLDEELGLIEVHLYRPFSQEYFMKELPDTVEVVAVLDRTKEPGSNGEPLYLDVVNALKDEKIKVVGGRYGLSSKNVAPRDIKAVYDMMDHPVNNFTIGIEDDVTHLSLKVDDNFKINNTNDILIYGFGSDGMVSLSKSIIKLIGEETNLYVQGYNEYDSKKSGGITVSHMRFSEKEFHKPYYVEEASTILISKDSYLKELNILNKVKENGNVIINTNKTEEQLLNFINDYNLKQINEKNIKVYTIDAYLEARKLGLNNKINMLLALPLISLSNLIDVDIAKSYFKNFVSKKYIKAGIEIISANIEALDKGISNLKEIKLIKDKYIEELDFKDFYDVLNKREGNTLKVSDVMDYKDGIFKPYHLNNSPISEIVPSWVSDNCIHCNQCSFVCPHNVIRPFILSIEEYEQSPSYVKEKCVKMSIPNYGEGYYILSFDIKSCTGCMLCVNTCPGKMDKKALIKASIEEKKDVQKQFDYLNSNIKDKKLFNENTVMGCMFKESGFSHPGSCAGCGETAYIKILTQLFKGHMIVANATGCSSIYGGSLNNMPYTIPWASSLFEDNAEFAYGILIGNNVMKNKIINIMQNNMDNPNNELFKKWLENPDDFENTLDVYNSLNYDTVPLELKEIKDYIVKRSIWTIGGDGWAYDIGFGGIDHVLASNDDVNILVLDSQVYSNTGGQSSKATPKSAIASFASSGKKTSKKDLARIALSYPNCYVATISIGANMMQVIKAFKEAEKHKGPSIIIAYTPCIAHGIDGGLVNSVQIEREAVECGYFPIFRYSPLDKKFNLDFKNVDFDKFEDFLNKQARFKLLKENDKNLMEQEKKEAIDRFDYYKMLSEK